VRAQARGCRAVEAYFGEVVPRFCIVAEELEANAAKWSERRRGRRRRGRRRRRARGPVSQSDELCSIFELNVGLEKRARTCHAAR
jgi:hypothetical protein